MKIKVGGTYRIETHGIVVVTALASPSRPHKVIRPGGHETFYVHESHFLGELRDGDITHHYKEVGGAD